MQSDFLRKKARALELLADACFDMDTSRRLRSMADEFLTVADREEKERPRLPFISAARGSGNSSIQQH